jgi:hypothetical protein
MIPDSVTTSVVRARCASEYTTSDLDRSDNIATLRAASRKYSDWVFKSYANYTENIDMQTVLMWGSSHPSREQKNLKRHENNESFTANAQAVFYVAELDQKNVTISPIF